MIIKRDKYLDLLIRHKHNGMIKIITGIRRCGKSFLLANFFKESLLNEGVREDHIVQIDFEDIKNKSLRDPEECYKYLSKAIKKDSKMHYILLDEVQKLEEFPDVLNGLMHFSNADVFVTGSNSHFLSKDVVTEFRGRGDEIRMYPLCFLEFLKAYLEDRKARWDGKDLTFLAKSLDLAWTEYYTYGGLPHVLKLETKEEKEKYLKDLFKETYLLDLIERYDIRDVSALDGVIDVVASDIGSLTNAYKIANSFSKERASIPAGATIKNYLDYLKDAFIIEEAKRYDIKGKKHLNSISKFYFEDLGLRNARLNFRQTEENHIMENIIFNELNYRGYSVDVGIVEIREMKNGSYLKKQTEIDFVINRGDQRYYVQSAFAMPTGDKTEKELRPLLNVNDSFKKIVVVKENVAPSRNSQGIVTIGLRNFLLDPDSLDY
ncbi:ATP-binding protein [bacterium]|nr:ATP-binding protein [bacterium]